MPCAKDRPTRIVDAHVHLFPERMFQAVWDYFEQRDWPVHREPVERIAQTLKDHGVELAIGLSYPHKAGVAGPLNRFMASVGASDPLFVPFASVHPEDEDLEAIVEHALGSPHLHGFKFQPLVQRFDVNHPRLDGFYERCQADQVPITMHMGSAPIANAYVGPEHLRTLLKRFPDLRVCVAHMGAPEYDSFLGLMADHPNMFLDTTMIQVPTDLFDTTFRGDPSALARCADRICFGSDWPNVPYAYREAIDSVPRFPWPEGAGAVQAVYRDNALRFLKLSEDLRPAS